MPGFGDGERLAVVGLAPAAHGASRTGRVFTGDRSGEWLFRALYAGLANQPHSVSADDGLRLHGVWISAPVRCVPPDNRPTPAERDVCAIPGPRTGVDQARRRRLPRHGAPQCAGTTGATRRFGHGAEIVVPNGTCCCSYHPSRPGEFPAS